MHRLEALRLLEAKLADIEEEREAELAAHEDLRDPIDAKAEARALSAVFDFLQNCKITPTASLLRVFSRYLHSSRNPARASGQLRASKSRAS